MRSAIGRHSPNRTPGAGGKADNAKVFIEEKSMPGKHELPLHEVRRYLEPGPVVLVTSWRA